MTVQILTNDVQVLILCLSYLITTVQCRFFWMLLYNTNSYFFNTHILRFGFLYNTLCSNLRHLYCVLEASEFWLDFWNVVSKLHEDLLSLIGYIFFKMSFDCLGCNKLWNIRTIFKDFEFFDQICSWVLNLKSGIW